MKKTLTLIVAVFVTSISFAQVKAGLKFSPTLALNSVADNDGDESISFGNNSVGVRFSTGLIIDKKINDNFYFGTGLWYTVKRAGLKVDSSLNPLSRKETYNLQYLQIPFTAKLYTNNIADDMKLYFQLGLTADIKISEKLISSKDFNAAPVYNAALQDDKSAVFSYFDSSLLIGSGVEWQWGDNTALFAGFSYNRGLINTINPFLKSTNGTKIYDDITLKTSSVSLDLGIKF